MDLIHKSHNLSKEIGKRVYLAFRRLKTLPQTHRGLLRFLSTAAQASEGRAPSSQCTSCGWTSSTWRWPSWTSWTPCSLWGGSAVWWFRRKSSTPMSPNVSGWHRLRKQNVKVFFLQFHRQRRKRRILRRRGGRRWILRDARWWIDITGSLTSSQGTLEIFFSMSGLLLKSFNMLLEASGNWTKYEI